MKEKSLFAGTPGQSVVGLMELINKVEDMLAAERDNAEAADFDVGKWVGAWIERPQPALGGLAPAELMDTPTGRESVMRVLGAIQSGAYQ